jgi:hypothetical protein|tara:strand:- start:34 stop:243 length:210 start_codon:yes stop_codon:yes gene_type:complete
MKITRTNPMTGNTVSMDIDVTPAQIVSWEGGELAQNAFPNIDAGQREFIMTGMTPMGWKFLFGGIDDES